MLIDALAAAVTIPREFTVNVATDDADPYGPAVTPDNGKSTLIVPDVVIGEPEILMVEFGLASDTEVTVPVPETICQDKVPIPSVVNTYPAVPGSVG
jgi:hypothetical protein